MQRILSRREKIIFYITVCTIIFAAGFNFLIAPMLAKNDSLNKEIGLARAKLKKYLWLLAQKEHIRSKYSRFSAFVPALPCQQEDVLVSAYTKLEALAKGAGIRIIDIRPAPASKGLTLYKETPIELRTEGGMENYLNFIYNLENSPLLLKIKSFHLNAKTAAHALDGNFLITHFSVSD